MKKLLLALLLIALLLPAALADIQVRPVHPVFPEVPTPEPTATPVPTRAPGTSVYFDYDALINDPEGHKGMSFFVVGTANRIDPMELNYGDWTRPASTLLSVDGELFKIAFVVFENPEGESEVKEGDPIQIFGEYIGTTELKTTLGAYITVPMILAHSVEKLDALP